MDDARTPKPEIWSLDIEFDQSDLPKQSSPFSSEQNSLLAESGTLVVEVIDNRDEATQKSALAPIDPRPSSTTLPLLLEVGCEEIPARYLREAEKGLGVRVQAALRQARLLESAGLGVLVESANSALHIEHSSLPGADLGVTTYSTPRRLVVHVPKILAHQADKIEEILGPPVKVAIDREGNYTRAAESFAQKNSAQMQDLTRTTTPKGEYLSLTKTIPGRSAHDILPEILPDAILGLSFPKSMYWTQKSAPRFVRPIRWIVALLGDGEQAAVVNFSILGVKSGNSTFGHRAKSREPISVAGLKDYTNKLSEVFVEIDYSIRKDRISEEAEAVAASTVGKIVPDDWLADWLANSTEWPRPLLGSFDPRFLHLPREILTTVMRDHQRYFAVEQLAEGGAQPDAEAKLAPNFVAVLNMDSDEKGLIRHGHQRVLTARFRDAEFFWATDQRVRLRDRRLLLDKVTYQEKLGSYGDKIIRMRQLAEVVCAKLEGAGQLRHGEAEEVLAAVDLCKCDLITQMVQEFTELQGVVGGLYAKAQGESEGVATAIYDHYLPIGAEGKSPRTLVGAIVSLTDKLDAVVGGFVAGLEPTGSRDPFALRRSGNGIVKVLVEFKIPFELSELVLDCERTFGNEHGEAQLNAISAFLLERLSFYLESVAGCRHDTVRAVLAAGSPTAIDALRRAQAVESLRDTDDYGALAAAAKRTRNILRKSASADEYFSGALDPELLQEEAERELYEAYKSIFNVAGSELAGEQDYETILTLTARLRPFIDKFFDKVLVMHSDLAIRKNRLLLLHLLDTKVFSRVADLSEIEGHVDAST